MEKKLLGPWEVLFPVSFRSGGDTTAQAFWKHIQEIDRIYDLLNALDRGKAGSDELIDIMTNLKHNSLKDIQGGTQDERYHLSREQLDKVDNAASAGDVIKNHNSLNGLEGGESEHYYHLTQAQMDGLSSLITNPTKVFDKVSLDDNGYIKFENGFIFQWGLRYFSRAEQNGSIVCNFNTAFTQKCYGVIGTYGFNHHGAERSFLGMWPRGDGKSQFGVSLSDFYSFTNISGDQMLDPCFRWLAWGK